MTKIASFFATVALIFTYLFGLGVNIASEGYELTENIKLPATVSMFSGQGLCYDEEYFYSSGSLTFMNFTGLAKFDENMKCIKKKSKAVGMKNTMATVGLITSIFGIAFAVIGIALIIIGFIAGLGLGLFSIVLAAFSSMMSAMESTSGYYY